MHGKLRSRNVKCHIMSCSRTFKCCRIQRLLQNDSLGCNAVSWAPYHSVSSHSVEHNGALIFRLVTGSCDNIVRIWRWIEGTSEGAWTEEAKTMQTPHSGEAWTQCRCSAYIACHPVHFADKWASSCACILNLTCSVFDAQIGYAM
jgi:hypothetical protein